MGRNLGRLHDNLWDQLNLLSLPHRAPLGEDCALCELYWGLEMSVYCFD